MPTPLFSLNDAVLLSIAAINVAIGFVIFLKQPRRAVNQTFFLFICGISCWMTGIALLYATHDFIYDKLALGGGLVMLFGMVLFARMFPSATGISKRFAVLVALPFVVAIALLPFNLYITDITVGNNGEVQPASGPFFPFYAFMTLSYSLLAAYYFVRNFRRSIAAHRMQMTYLITGISVFFFVLIVCDLILPAFGIFELNLLGPAASIFFVTMTAYAIVRHQLLDIRVVVQRSLIYTLLLGLIITCFAVLVSALGTLFNETTRTTYFVSAIATTVLGILGAPFIESRFRKMTDRIFFKDTYDYAEALHELSQLLHQARSFEDIVDRIETYLTSALRAHGTSIVLNEETAQKADGSDAAAVRTSIKVPIVLDEVRIGSIEVGSKRSGDPYSLQDVRMVETIAYQVASALARVRLYREAERHAHELEDKVNERTLELSDAREQERRMMTDLSHNLQTPLAVLQTKLESLKSRLPDDPEILSVEQSLMNLSDFIYEILSFSQLTRERADTNERIDLSDLMRDVAEEIGTIAASRDIEVGMKIRSGIEVCGVRKRLREALMNLANNSLKYLPVEGVRQVGFSLDTEEECAVIVVSDTGIGIPEDELPRIFDRFYRGASSLKATRGTGLGLAIAKQITEQHGGTIAAYSAPESETEMTLRIPLHP